MSPAGVGAFPNIISQALPSDLSPIEPRSPYLWEQDDSYDPNEDLLERYLVNMGPGAGTARMSPGVLNTPPAGDRTPVRTSTQTQGATVASVGSTAFNNW